MSFELGIALRDYPLPEVTTDWADDILRTVLQDLVAIGQKIGKAIELMQ